MIEIIKMNEIIFTSALMTMTMAVAAIVIVYVVLRFLDHLSDFDFRGFMNEKDKANMAHAIYLGCRFIGACILIGLLFS